MKPTLVLLSLFVLAPALPAASSAEAPLPSVDEILRRIIERAPREAENDRQFNAHYSFTRTKRTDTWDTKGELKDRQEKSDTHNPPAPVAGAPKSSPPPKTPMQKKDFLQDGDMLKRFDFTLKGREHLDGRPVLVLDFAPAAGDLPVKDFKDHFVNKAAGRVWIDETEAVVTKADLRLTGEVSVVLGLVGVVKHGVLSFERERTPEGWWFTRLATWHLEGREVFTRKVMDFEEKKKDVRRVM